MSRAPTSRSPDLQRLRDEGYRLSLLGSSLVVHDVPYVDADARLRRGALVVALRLTGDRTAAPDGHGACWSGSEPCDRFGRRLANVVQGALKRDLGGVTVSYALCNMPFGREFGDYHDLVTAYVSLISCHATAFDPTASATTERGIIVVDDRSSPFRYLDTASRRAGLGALQDRFPDSVAIVGLGGTGSYVLDLVAKTPVGTIHLIDGDVFDQHNAFRAPGAASMEDIDARRSKVHHFADVYSRMHAGIVPHALRLTPKDLGLLDHAGFVFLCMDDGPAKRPIVERLERNGRSFIDVGMGLEADERGVFGLLRVTTSTPTGRAHVLDRHRIPFGDGEQDRDDAYRSNIQVADLNMLNAALAVVRWKRLIGFYVDDGTEHQSIYEVGGNQITNADG